MTTQEFEAKFAKVVAAYRSHPNAVSAFEGPRAVCRDFDDAVVAAGENAGQEFDPRLQPAEYLDLFEASLEGILSA